MRRLILVWLLPLLVADQALKFYIKLNFLASQPGYPGTQVDLIPGILELVFIENNGMAFGWALPGVAGKMLLTSFRIIAAVVIGLYLSKLVKEKAHKGLLVCVTLIWAGAIGNIIDGAFYGLIFTESISGPFATAASLSLDGYAPLFMGKVVDMFHFVLKWPSWMPFEGEIFPPIWNIADAAISISVIWIIIRQGVFFRSNED